MDIIPGIRTILQQHGRDILRRPQQFRALLEDLCFEACPAERNIVSSIVQDGLLMDAGGFSFSERRKKRIEDRLHTQYGYDRAIIIRTVTYWEEILGVNSESQEPDIADVESIMEEVDRLCARGETKDAVERLNQAISIEPNNPSIHAMLAQIHLNESNLRDAKLHIKRALEVSPADTDILCLYGKIHL